MEVIPQFIDRDQSVSIHLNASSVCVRNPSVIHSIAFHPNSVIREGHKTKKIQISEKAMSRQHFKLW